MLRISRLDDAEAFLALRGDRAVQHLLMANPDAEPPSDVLGVRLQAGFVSLTKVTGHLALFRLRKFIERTDMAGSAWLSCRRRVAGA